MVFDGLNQPMHGFGVLHPHETARSYHEGGECSLGGALLSRRGVAGPSDCWGSPMLKMMFSSSSDMPEDPIDPPHQADRASVRSRIFSSLNSMSNGRRLLSQKAWDFEFKSPLVRPILRGTAPFLHARHRPMCLQMRRIDHKPLARPCDNGRYGSIRRICAFNSQIRF